LKYDDNRSALDLLKKMFLKVNKNKGNVNFDMAHTQRLMAETHSFLSEDQKKEYQTWEELEIFKIQIQREREATND